MRWLPEEVDTGGVISMVSTPSYDPNLFVTGISAVDYKELNTSPLMPLYNRSLQGLYPPGSTLKPMLGLGGLESGVITREPLFMTRVLYPSQR